VAGAGGGHVSVPLDEVAYRATVAVSAARARDRGFQGPSGAFAGMALPATAFPSSSLPYAASKQDENDVTAPSDVTGGSGPG